MRLLILSIPLFVLILGCDNPSKRGSVAAPVAKAIPEPTRSILPDSSVDSDQSQEHSDNPAGADDQEKTLRALKKEASLLEKKSGILPSHQPTVTPSPKLKISFIVVGSFRTLHFLHLMEKRIKDQKLHYVVTPVVMNGKHVQTVKIGPFKSTEEAEKKLEDLKSIDFPEDAFVR